MDCCLFAYRIASPCVTDVMLEQDIAPLLPPSKGKWSQNILDGGAAILHSWRTLEQFAQQGSGKGAVVSRPRPDSLSWLWTDTHAQLPPASSWFPNRSRSTTLRRPAAVNQQLTPPYFIVLTLMQLFMWQAFTKSDYLDERLLCVHQLEENRHKFNLSCQINDQFQHNRTSKKSLIA